LLLICRSPPLLCQALLMCRSHRLLSQELLGRLLDRLHYLLLLLQVRSHQPFNRPFLPLVMS